MFTFDYNGNILTQQRYEGSTLVDSLTYHYATNSAGDLLSNRLYSVDDAVTVASLSATDMEDMPAYNNATPNTSNNYKYTQIGELKSDNQEEIQEIVWRVDSKISEIVRTSGSAKKNLKFEYDAMGNRVAKHVYAGSVLESSTYYVRDAQGNVMGVYEHKMDAENAVMEYKLIERNIYGSAQVGICKDTVDLNITNASGSLTQATYYHARQLNHRQYSLSNHLGNVLTTLGDGKAPVDSNSDGVIDYYVAYIISVSDYSPFGVELASRTWSIEEYRSGFNGKEKVTEITGNSSDYDFGARIYDARIGRWFGVDSKHLKNTSTSTYNYVENNPIIYVDPDGRDKIIFIKTATFTTTTFRGDDRIMQSSGLTISYSIEIIKNSEPDAFYWREVKTNESEEVNQNRKSPFEPYANLISSNSVIESEQLFNPWNNNSYSGFTHHISQFCDGIFGIEESDRDALTVGKFILMSPEFEIYLSARHSETKDWKWSAEASNALDEFTTTMNVLRIAIVTESVATYGIAGRGLVVGSQTTAKGIMNVIPKGELANHLFKGAGKLADNPANRTLIQNISNGKALGVDAFGKSWYKGVDGAGKSIYSYTQNGIVKGAGYMNMTPAEMIIKYGLK